MSRYHELDGLDRWITGNDGEDQFAHDVDLATLDFGCPNCPTTPCGELEQVGDDDEQYRCPTCGFETTLDEIVAVNREIAQRQGVQECDA